MGSIGSRGFYNTFGVSGHGFYILYLHHRNFEGAPLGLTSSGVKTISRDYHAFRVLRMGPSLANVFSRRDD